MPVHGSIPDLEVVVIWRGYPFATADDSSNPPREGELPRTLLLLSLRTLTVWLVARQKEDSLNACLGPQLGFSATLCHS